MKLPGQFCQLGFDANGPAVVSQAAAACALHAGVTPLRWCLEANFVCAHHDALFVEGSFVKEAPAQCLHSTNVMCVCVVVGRMYCAVMGRMCCAAMVQRGGLVILTKALVVADYAE